VARSTSSSPSSTRSAGAASRASPPANKKTLTGVLLVSDEEIAAAVRFLLLRGKLLVEPTGAVPAAAFLAGKLPMPKGSRVGVVLSGGNIDPALLAEILSADG